MKYLGDTQDEKSIVPQENLQTYISWNSSTNTIQKTINGITTDIVTLPLIPGTGIKSAQGGEGTASGENSFAFERGIASGDYSFAVGSGSQAIGTGSIAFMRGIARGMGSFALGGQNGEQRQPEAAGVLSVAIGASTYASGTASVAIGLQTTASAAASIALGNRTIAGSANQTVIGRRNIEDTNNIYAFIIGNGTADNARSNAFMVDWNGNVTATSFTGTVSGYLPLTGGKVSGTLTLQNDLQIQQGGTSTDNIYFGSYAKEGSNYTTINQGTWGRFYFTIPALKISDNTYQTEQFIFLQYSHNNGVKTNYYESYRLPTCELNLSQNQSYDILTTKKLITIVQGGTGLSSSPSLLVNLSRTTATNIFTSSPRPGVTGTLSITNGGTGATTPANARANLGISSATSFAGTLGTNGTITNLPTAASTNQGDTYRVITTGTYANQNAKVGDLFTSNGSSWIYTPFLGDRFNNAGINNRTYITEVSETTVTTEYSDWHNSYYAYVAERDNNLVRGHQYKITFDGTEYYGYMSRWFQSGLDVNNTNGEGSNMWWSKGVTFFGNLSLFCDASGFYDVEYYNTFIDPSKDFPFVITNMYNIFPYISPEKIFIYTKTAGQHTVKIERIDYDMELIPNSLIWGNELKPIYERVGAGTPYTGTSIGVNNMLNRKSTFVFGDNNTMAEQAGIIVGTDNTVSGVGGVAVGNRNIASGAMASAFGYNTESAGQYAESHGYKSLASGIVSTSHGFKTTANHRSQFVFGEYNIIDDSSAATTNRGNYIEIVGNGTSTSLSNARTLDWSGNESLAGGITLGKGTADEVTLTAAQLKQLKQLINA